MGYTMRTTANGRFDFSTRMGKVFPMRKSLSLL
jgi:hypothetical protein